MHSILELGFCLAWALLDQMTLLLTVFGSMNESTLRYILDNIILLACAEINPGSINRPGPIL